MARPMTTAPCEYPPRTNFVSGQDLLTLAMRPDNSETPCSTHLLKSPILAFAKIAESELKKLVAFSNPTEIAGYFALLYDLLPSS